MILWCHKTYGWNYVVFTHFYILHVTFLPFLGILHVLFHTGNKVSETFQQPRLQVACVGTNRNHSVLCVRFCLSWWDCQFVSVSDVCPIVCFFLPVCHCCSLSVSSGAPFLPFQCPQICYYVSCLPFFCQYSHFHFVCNIWRPYTSCIVCPILLPELQLSPSPLPLVPASWHATGLHIKKYGSHLD